MAEELEKKRLTELAARSWNQGIFCFTHFLDLAGLSLFHSLVPSLPPVAARISSRASVTPRRA